MALGLASGCLERLESTNIPLVINGVFNLLDHFPDRAFDLANIEAYSRELLEELAHIRDFLLLHYWGSARDDAPFRRDVRAVRLPDSLAQRIELYPGTGRIRPGPGELFTDLAWFYIFAGLGIRPAALDPLIDARAFAHAQAAVQRLRQSVAAEVAAAHAHDSFFGSGRR